MPYHSQYRQDQTIDRLLSKSDGLFVEIGAYDGRTYSNTYYFETERNWSGICIEPVPELFQKVQKNRSCITVQGCISDTEGYKAFCRCHGRTEMLSGLVDFYDEQHRQRIETEIAEHGGSWEEFDVKCYTLGELLDKHDMSTVDYCSIDTEGGELEILGTIDFDRYNIRALSIEDNYEDQRIIRFMTGKGYSVLCRNSCDLIFVRDLRQYLHRPAVIWLLMKERLKKQLRRSKALHSGLVRLRTLFQRSRR